MNAADKTAYGLIKLTAQELVNLNSMAQQQCSACSRKPARLRVDSVRIIVDAAEVTEHGDGLLFSRQIHRLKACVDMQVA